MIQVENLKRYMIKDVCAFLISQLIYSNYNLIYFQICLIFFQEGVLKMV